MDLGGTPVVMISVITIPGVLPILLETHHQALVRIPIATTLAFDLMFNTTTFFCLPQPGCL